MDTNAELFLEECCTSCWINYVAIDLRGLTGASRNHGADAGFPHRMASRRYSSP